MQEIVAALREQHEELERVLGSLSEQSWATPTPRCPGWTVSDVVLHLAQTDEMALASVRGRFDASLDALAGTLTAMSSVDEGAGAIVASQRGAPPADVQARWNAGSGALREALVDIAPSTRVRWVVGDLAARTLATTRLAECWIHTGDVLTALGRPIVAVDRIRHIARLAWRTLPYAFASAGRELSGPVRFDLRGPGDAVWDLAPDEPAVTTIRGSALDLCQVAGQRVSATDTDLRAVGPDADLVLALVRTFA